ncbi:MAG: acyl--CoA ligase [Deltaproteobacteria bacterium]|nr:acyl--CoA ligase [Deltaproteobacteria bacterium]
MLIPELLHQAAARFPDKPAAIFPEGRISFRELDEKSNQVAQRLRKLGVQPNDRVALLWDNALTGFIAFWGTLKAGAQNVDMPGLAGKATLEGILEESKPKALAIDPKLYEKLGVDGIPAGLPKILLSEGNFPELPGHQVERFEQIFGSEPKDRPPLTVDRHDPSLIVYTSGTTGRPKGVMLSHDNLISNISAANQWVGLTHEDSILVVVPTYFIHGRMQILTHAMIGGTLVFSAGFHFPKQVVQEIVESGVTGFSGVPYHMKTLLKTFKATKFEKLRYVLVTGGALSVAEQETLQDALPGIGLHNAYGQTEASPRITYLGPKEMFVERGSSGRPLPGVTIDLVDDEGNLVPPGQPGEVAVRGPGIMKGYVSGDHVETGRIDSQGRLRTGDLGEFRGEYLYLVGRKSDMMKLAGERVFPKEIEDVINLHPAVTESAVFAVPDDRMGEKLHAFVVVHPGQSLDLAELRTHCLKHMSFVRTPRELHLVPALPKTGSGKINRSELKALLQPKS